MGTLLDELNKVAKTEDRSIAAHRTWALIKACGFEKTKAMMSRSRFYAHLKLLVLAGLSRADLCNGNLTSSNLTMKTMKKISYFTISVTVMRGRITRTLGYIEHKEELSLSPHVRLCGFDAMACINSRELANQFSAACAPILKKRYGNETTAKVVEASARVKTEDKYLVKRIQEHSKIIRQRIATGNYSPNKTV